MVELVEEDTLVCENIYAYGCSCMLGLVDRGFSIEGLDAQNLQVNAFIGNVGDLILFYFPRTDTYHVGEIIVKFPSNNMIVYECNYTPATCGERLVMVSDSTIRGYLHKIRQ